MTAHLIAALRPGLAAMLLALATLGQGQAAAPDRALAELLAQARLEMPERCGKTDIDALLKVLCSGTLRVGIRGHYPLFATRMGETRVGYDTDVARAVAERLDLEVVWVHVRAATRISTLAEGGADLVVATMGHNTRRDAQARFIRPHYYRSETIIVGPREVPVAGWHDLTGRVVCTTIGNYSNSFIVSRNIRVMLFEFGDDLTAALANESCQFVAQDDSFLASYLADPVFSPRFERKFGFDPIPWGMAVGLDGTTRLATALELMSQIMHRDGVFLDLAIRHGIFTDFLEAQQGIWRAPPCTQAGAIGDPACVIPPLHSAHPPTAFADEVDAALGWIERQIGTAPMLPMLQSEPAWQLFLTGIVNSLVLVLGALAATLVFALLIGGMAAGSWAPLRLLAWLIVTILQSSPVLLTLVVASAVAQALFAYSTAVALGAAILALGLMNGGNAGQAIGEAAASLRREGAHAGPLTFALFRAALARSITQILSFLVNAAKGTPIASFTGAPELLSALTDITAFAAGRVTTYTLVLVFYVVVVVTVVWVCNRVRARIARAQGLS
ncbi:MAG: transporter substrate-binding domain-containing protein [Pikeienuella sp.]